MIRGHWEPQTEQEDELLEDLFLVTRHAHNEGVSRARVASLLAFMAAAAADTSIYEADDPRRSQPPQEPTETAVGTEETTCPICDGPINHVVAGMGLNPVQILPCGHEITEEDIEGDLEEWFRKAKGKTNNE